ncbi:hypothetical protein ScPMuIL_018850 [Solemya velum]
MTIPQRVSSTSFVLAVVVVCVYGGDCYWRDNPAVSCTTDTVRCGNNLCCHSSLYCCYDNTACCPKVWVTDAEIIGLSLGALTLSLITILALVFCGCVYYHKTSDILSFSSEQWPSA